MLRVLTLSTLFPSAIEPSFGVFVEGQTLRLAARADVDLHVVNPIARPRFPLRLHPRYRRQRALPDLENWKGVPTARPRFATVPGLSGALNPAAIDRAVRPVLARLRASEIAFDVIDAEFFYPDGPAAARLAALLGVPFSIKARGADIHYWATRPACLRLMLEAAEAASGLLAVAGSLKQDMAALGMDPAKITVHYTGVDLDRFQPVERSGPERETLGRLGAARGLGERVRLLGSLPHASLPAILGAADVMALASASEGLANAWIEAMACGTPVVTPRVDGAAEAIDQPAAGRLVDERPPVAMATAVAAVLADPPPQQAVRACARRFTWERHTQALFDHLSRIVANQDRVPADPDR